MDCAPPSEPDMRISRIRLSICDFAESSVARVPLGRRAKVLRGFPGTSSSAFDFPTHHSWLRASPRLLWPHSSSSESNRLSLLNGVCLPKRFRFLPPLAPRALPRFLATMAALTPARFRFRGLLPAQASTVRHDNFHAYPAQPPPTIRSLTFDESCRSVRLWLWPQASPLAIRLAIVEGRIGFTCVRVCAFASGCSPPRLAATQLPSASLPLLVTEGLRLSLVVIMVTSFALATAVPCRVGQAVVKSQLCKNRRIGGAKRFSAY